MGRHLTTRKDTVSHVAIQRMFNGDVIRLLRHLAGPHRPTLLGGGATPDPCRVHVAHCIGQTLLGDGASVAHGAGSSHDRFVCTTADDELCGS
jgi:hypothetical protein